MLAARRHRDRRPPRLVRARRRLGSTAGRRLALRRGRARRRPHLPGPGSRAPAASGAPGSRSAPRSSAGAPAEVYWTAAILDDPSPPYPSPADIGYLAFYPLAALGLVPAGPRPRPASSTGGSGWTGRSPPSAPRRSAPPSSSTSSPTRPSGTSLQVATTLAYPLGDIAMLALSVGVVALTSWRPGPRLDAAARRLRRAGRRRHRLHACSRPTSALPEGVWIEPDLPDRRLSASAPRPGSSASGEITLASTLDGWRELMVPAVFAAVMIGLFAMQYSSTSSGLATVLWAATMIAVIVRLGDQRPREQRAARAGPDRPADRARQPRRACRSTSTATARRRPTSEPVAILLFDLNGFKRYNDTFGHPAGDELLAELGGALRGAVGDDGIAYRFGGDEFCVLLTCRARALRRGQPREAAIGADRERERASTSAPPGERRRSRTRPRPRTRRCSSPTCACTRRRSRAAPPATSDPGAAARAARPPSGR